MGEIDRFYGEYQWLSNFWPCQVWVRWNENLYLAKSVEHAYQASKAVEYSDFCAVLAIDGAGKAKRYGRKIKWKPSWKLEEFRIQTMRDLVRQKFNNNPDLKQKLLDTGDAELIEGNNWHDNFWGDCICEYCRRNWFNNPPKNYLGHILMEIRNELRKSQVYSK